MQAKSLFQYVKATRVAADCRFRDFATTMRLRRQANISILFQFSHAIIAYRHRLTRRMPAISGVLSRATRIKISHQRILPAFTSTEISIY